ncbi:MAG: cytochrome c family protein [SAR324 cluster bacterium]|nr:cytochrome c family protein [SAR324 cluster bacterium]
MPLPSKISLSKSKQKIFKIPVFFTKCLLITLVIASWSSQPVLAQSKEIEPVTPYLASANPAIGKQIAVICRVCHNLQKGEAHKIGPNLWNIVQTKIASKKGFTYTPALKNLKGNWEYETLNHFLEDPMTYAKGTMMAFRGLKSNFERVHVIAYLNTLSDNPGSLPEGDQKKASSMNEAILEASFFGSTWPTGAGSMETGFVCGRICHSEALVQQQGQTREGWEEVIEWMVEEQGMEKLDDDMQDLILSYLSKHFNVE